MKRYQFLSYFVILLFFIINLITLLDFPVIHSDEIWLKGIATHMMNSQRFDVTEPFYDLYPRVVHPFRWLYNGLLILAFNLTGDTIFTMRLVSLISMTLMLMCLIPILNRRFGVNATAPLALTILAFNIQLVATAHTGRQESIILLIMMVGYFLYMANAKNLPIKLSLLLVLSFGIHPNSFLIGATFSALLFFGILMNRSSIRQLLAFWGLTVAGLLTTVMVGLSMNPNFISGYLAYGESLGVDSEPLGRFSGFYWYFVKLYHQIGGTYDLYQIKGPLLALFILLTFFFVYWIFHRFIKRRTDQFEIFLPSVMVLAILVGLLFIGRYNQTAVVFFMPFVMLMLIEWINFICKKPLVVMSLLIVLLTASGFNLQNNMSSYWQQRFYVKNYGDVIDELQTLVSKDAIVLGNLNTLEAFDPYRFYDVRNLGYLTENGLDFETYIRDRNIDTLVLHEEMDYLYRTSPKWDFLYVNLDYYEDMQRFIDEHCVLVKSFENPLYAMRISKFSGTYPWKTAVYKVLP